MNDQHYTTSITVDQTPEVVFKAISNTRDWWSEQIIGGTDKLESVFYYSYKDVHRGTFQITEYIPGQKIVWHVLQNYFSFITDTTEWTGTNIIFEISVEDGKTVLRFTHVGLKPSEECYGVCHDEWGFYIRTSLKNLITKGTGEPNKKDTLSKNNPVQK